MMLIEDKVVDYRILSDKVISNNEIKYIVKLEYATGEISEVPILMTKEDSLWKVSVSSSSLENEEDKILQEATSIAMPSPRHFLCDWSFSGRRDNKEFYSNCTFNISKSNAAVNLAVVQNNTSSLNLGISYTIVQKRVLGDNVWGSRYVSGIRSSTYVTSVSGKSTTFSGAKIRFQTDGHYEKPGFSGFGSVY